MYKLFRQLSAKRQKQTIKLNTQDTRSPAVARKGRPYAVVLRPATNENDGSDRYPYLEERGGSAVDALDKAYYAKLSITVTLIVTILPGRLGGDAPCKFGGSGSRQQTVACDISSI